jgi:hypothetical protein
MRSESQKAVRSTLEKRRADLEGVRVYQRKEAKRHEHGAEAAWAKVTAASAEIEGIDALLAVVSPPAEG